VNVRDWLHVDDHVEAVWAVVMRGRAGETYNVGGDSERRNVDVVDAICASVARHTGAPVEDLLALKTYVTDRPGHDHRYAIDASKIRAELGWAPTRTFEQGIDDTVRWYLDHRAWVDEVRSGEYRKWMDQNYGARA
jgi:dTDP-glucose 4,6-dehydratase